MEGGDSILGGSGDDTLSGGWDSTDTSPRDTLVGGDGNDLLIGSSAHGLAPDIYEGGAGDDTVQAGWNDDRISLGEGNDVVVRNSYGGFDTVSGGAGNDVVETTFGRIDGGDGDDEIRLIYTAYPLGGDLSREVFVQGGAGEDTLLIIGKGRIFLDSFGAENGFEISAGIDVSGTGKGNVLDFSSLQSTGGVAVFGRAGSDRLVGIAANGDSLKGGLGADTLEGLGGNDTLLGGDGGDLISGGTGGDSLEGGKGSDTLLGGVGNDTLLGGTQQDTVSYAGAIQAIEVDLARGKATGEGVDSLASIEDVQGSEFADRLRGDGSANNLDGGAGNDTLEGAEGPDRLTGGGGTDTFVFRSVGDTAVGKTSRDVITDFVDGDLIDLSAIDAVAGTRTNDAFVLTEGFTGAAGQLVVVQGTGSTLVRGDVNGDAHADFEIVVTFSDSLGLDDFVL
jgi:Ca2+-binding RTX toxin-like protein